MGVWLQGVNAVYTGVYGRSFDREAHSLRDLLLLEDSDMETFGVTNKFHRKCIMTAVTALKLRQNPDQPRL